MPASQAGRRRFDPGLPLHVLTDEIPAEPTVFAGTPVSKDVAYFLVIHDCNNCGTSSAAGPRWTSSKYRALAGSVSPRKIVRAGCGFCLSMVTKLATGCTDPDVPMAINVSHPSSAP